MFFVNLASGARWRVSSTHIDKKVYRSRQVAHAAKIPFTVSYLYHTFRKARRPRCFYLLSNISLYS